MPKHIVVVGEGSLAEAIRAGLQQWGHVVHLITSTDAVECEPDVVWLAVDTPVTAQGKPALAWLRQGLELATATLQPDTLVLVSSQVPVGFAAQLQNLRPGAVIVSVPENLRRGAELRGFLEPPFIAVGVSPQVDRSRILEIYPDELHERILWMSPESAEMSKHAINTFLGMSISFANEMERACRAVGATYDDVERVLRSDPRIGRKAYVASGSSDSSHFLRDMRYLRNIKDYRSPLIEALLLQLSKVNCDE